jgi:hypothetical protein
MKIGPLIAKRDASRSALNRFGICSGRASMEASHTSVQDYACCAAGTLPSSAGAGSCWGPLQPCNALPSSDSGSPWVNICHNDNMGGVLLVRNCKRYGCGPNSLHG